MAGIAKATQKAADAKIFSADEYTPEQILAELGLKRISIDMPI